MLYVPGAETYADTSKKLSRDQRQTSIEAARAIVTIRLRGGCVKEREGGGGSGQPPVSGPLAVQPHLHAGAELYLRREVPPLRGIVESIRQPSPKVHQVPQSDERRSFGRKPPRIRSERRVRDKKSCVDGERPDRGREFPNRPGPFFSVRMPVVLGLNGAKYRKCVASARPEENVDPAVLAVRRPDLPRLKPHCEEAVAQEILKRLGGDAKDKGWVRRKSRQKRRGDSNELNSALVLKSYWQQKRTHPPPARHAVRLFTGCDDARKAPVRRWFAAKKARVRVRVVAEVRFSAAYGLAARGAGVVAGSPSLK